MWILVDTGEMDVARFQHENGNEDEIDSFEIGAIERIRSCVGDLIIPRCKNQPAALDETRERP
jgi:hypothetical protein